MVDTRKMLQASRRRATGGILSHCENSDWWGKLTPAQRNALRDKVLSDFAAFNDVVFDVLRAVEGDADGVTNERALQLLEEIHGLVRGSSLREVTGNTVRGGGVPLSPQALEDFAITSSDARH